MGQVRTALAALADHSAGPGELLERLDGFLPLYHDARTGKVLLDEADVVLDQDLGLLVVDCDRRHGRDRPLERD